jgi:hypothetical protein
VIQRDPAEVRRSWATWDGAISDAAFAEVLSTVSSFCEQMAARPNVLTVPYEDLERYDAVNRLVIHCTDRALKARTWQLFHLLKIELLKSKCQPRPGELDSIRALAVL